MNGRKIIADGKRVSVESSAGGYSRLLFAIISIIFLGLLGFVYAHEILIPFLLDYLAKDASTAGLDSTWQLRSWIGFIMGLYIGSIVSFQIPLVLVILIRAGLLDRNTVTDNRSFLWFAAAVFGAFVSPPDPLSMFLIGGPMLVILEIALLLERITKR